MASNKINTDPKKIDEILNRGVANIYNKEELREKLLSGKKLHLKLGTDVTGSFLHLGHSVIHRKIRDFQELGHKVTLIIGDFTTLVGDHSDKLDMRDERDESTIKRDEENYKEQFFKTVLKEETEIRHNSEWLRDLNFRDIIKLTKEFTVSQMLDRETFRIRFEQKKPIPLDEWMYPLMQGYDSIALNCDVEFGATDQTFNVLAGRKLMEVYGLKPQSCVLMKLLTGNDGRPMGKSLKNYIPIMDKPSDMYGKLMSIVDEVIFDYFELVTRIPLDEIEKMKSEIKNGRNPMEIKKILAKDIVSFYHGEGLAEEATKEFEKVVQNKDYSDLSQKEYIDLDSSTLISDLALKYKFVNSKGEFKRLIDQKAIKFNDKIITDYNFIIQEEGVLKVGKKSFVQIVKK